MDDTNSLTKKQIALWGLAVIVVFAVLFIIGWKGFYGYIVPQTNSLGSFSTLGLLSFAALAGLMVNFGPCSLAVLPAYLSYHLGLSGKGRELEHPLAYGLKTGLIAAVGVVSFYIVLGAALASIGTGLAAYSAQIKLVVAAFILVLGASFLVGSTVSVGGLDKLRGYVRRFTEGRSKTVGLVGFGVIYGAGGLSCFLPVFLPLVFSHL